MRIRNKQRRTRDGRKYELVGAADETTLSLKTQKGWSSIVASPRHNYTPPKGHIPNRSYNYFRACDLFLVARWPSFREVFPKGASRKIKSK